MTEDEFQFWQAAYIAALAGNSAIRDMTVQAGANAARVSADAALVDYRYARSRVTPE